jgi:hypothetical protein
MKELAAIADEAVEARLPFLIIGGLAVNAYGHTRTTYDADFLIPRRDLPAWKALLQKFGYVVRHEQETFTQFQAPLNGMRPVDLMLVNDRTFEKLSREARLLQDRWPAPACARAAAFDCPQAARIETWARLAPRPRHLGHCRGGTIVTD